jgi:hypothetical protein
VSGGADGITVWDRRTNSSMLKIEHTGNLGVLRLDELKIVAGYEDGSMNIYNFCK